MYNRFLMKFSLMVVVVVCMLSFGLLRPSVVVATENEVMETATETAVAVDALAGSEVVADAPEGTTTTDATTETAAEMPGASPEEGTGATEVELGENPDQDTVDNPLPGEDPVADSDPKVDAEPTEGEASTGGDESVSKDVKSTSEDQEILPGEEEPIEVEGESEEATLPEEPKQETADRFAPAALTTFEELKAAIAGAATDGSQTEVDVAGDIAFTEGLTIDEGRNITLKSVLASAARFFWADGAMRNTSMITIRQGAALTLDGASKDDLVFDGENKTSNVSRDKGIFIRNEGDLTINQATFRNGKAARDNEIAPIYAKGATARVTFNDGLIEKNDLKDTYYSSGGFFLNDGAKMTMNGGTIQNNRVSYYEPYFTVPDVFNKEWAHFLSAGAIQVHNGSELVMNDGLITENFSYTGGIATGHYGLEKYNRKATDPSELSILPISKFFLNGGTITKNTGAGASGGVLVFGAGEAVMTGGTISENLGYQGGGVLAMDWYVDGIGKGQTRAKVSVEEWSRRYPAAFTMKGGEVVNNTASSTGGGLNFSTYQGKITGGLISGNYAGNQGGGVYVTAVPNLLYVENAYISGNKALVDTWVKSTGVDEKVGDQWIRYPLGLGVGGGIWFCPTGDAIIYVENGIALFGNTAETAGDDFHNEDKVPGSYTVTLPLRTADGTRILWYEDKEGNRYDPTDPHFMEKIAIRNVSEQMSLKAILDGGEAADLKDLYAVIVTGNTSNKGGGFGSNGTIIFGTAPEEDNPLKEITVRKVWENANDGDIPEEIVIWMTLDGRKVEKMTLRAENNWQYTLRDLPATIGGVPLEDLLGFVEETEGKWDFTVGDITATGVAVEDAFGEWILTLQTTLTNAVTPPEEPPVTPPDEPEKPPVTPPDEPEEPPVTPPEIPEEPPQVPPEQPEAPPVIPEEPPSVPPETPEAPPDVPPETPEAPTKPEEPKKEVPKEKPPVKEVPQVVKDAKPVPKTGQSNSPTAWLILMGLSLCTGTAIRRFVA